MLGVFAVLLSCGSLAVAQAPVNPAILDQQGPSSPWMPAISHQLPGVSGTGFWSGEGSAPTPSFWVNSEYMLWSIKDSQPLFPGQTPLFDSKGLEDHFATGLRLSIGGALDPAQKFGFEGSGSFLQQQSTGFHALPHQGPTR